MTAEIAGRQTTRARNRRGFFARFPDQPVDLLSGLFLFAFFFLLYLDTLYFGFIGFDDRVFLIQQPQLFDNETLWKSIQTVFSDFPREEPLIVRDLTWVLDSYLFGFGNPFGYRLGNITLNALNSVLLFAWLVQITGRRRVSFWASLLHFTSPICVESVAWIMERKGLLSTFFLLLSLIAFTSFFRSRSVTRRSITYSFSLVTTVCALLSKISALVIPGILVLLVLYETRLVGNGCAQKSQPYGPWLRKQLLCVLPHVTVCLVMVVWYLYMVSNTALMAHDRASDFSAHLIEFLVFTPFVIFRYLYLMFLSNSFSIYYTWPDSGSLLSAGGVFGATILTLLLCFVGFLLFLKRRAAFFFFICFFVILFPYFEFVDDGLWIANRYLYLAGFCPLALLLFLGDGVLGTAKKNLRVLGWVFVGSLLIWNMYRTMKLKACFSSPYALYQHEVKMSSPGPRAYGGLARAAFDLADEEVDRNKRHSLLLQALEICNLGFRDLGMDEFRADPKYGREHAILAYYRALTIRDLGLGEDRVERNLLFALDIFPDSTPVLKELSHLYYRRAKTTTHKAVERENAEKALTYLIMYFETPQIGYVNAQEREAVIKSLKAEFPYLCEREW